MTLGTFLVEICKWKNLWKGDALKLLSLFSFGHGSWEREGHGNEGDVGSKTT